uniref:BTB/POZ domain-containing protein KCTD7 n=1 Tax=Eptatretus burgeri TaxID=7764 RepID=A0A8C4WZ99_EPTBU
AMKTAILSEDEQPFDDMSEESEKRKKYIMKKSFLASNEPSCRTMQFPEVVHLNVGGECFSTCLSTLRRYENSMLATMFSGRHRIPRDSEGRYFIDRDGTYFRDILNFLRSGEIPQMERVREVYREAQYYALRPLMTVLEEMQPLLGERVRQAFLDLLPYYTENLERIITVAREKAIQRKARLAKLRVCVFKEELPVTPYERTLFPGTGIAPECTPESFQHKCNVDVSFGPWTAIADVYDLLHCLTNDLHERGITSEQQCIGVCDKHLVSHYYCKRPIYEFKITWW